jgi:hypothetical protein
MTLILLISFLWAYLEGKREAQYFHYKWSLPSPTKIKDEHFDFAIQRSLYVLISSLLAGFIFNWLAAFIIFISIALTFSFFHNGSYYKRRNEMNENVYLFRWKDESTTTTAKFSFSYKWRLIQFIIGVILSLGFDLFILFK